MFKEIKRLEHYHYFTIEEVALFPGFNHNGNTIFCKEGFCIVYTSMNRQGMSNYRRRNQAKLQTTRL